MTPVLSPEERAHRWGLVAKIAVFVVVGVIAAPIVALAIKGLVGLIIAAALGFVGLALMPVIGMKTANWKLKMLKAEAAANPIETLQNEFLRQQRILEGTKAKIETFNTKILTFRDKLAGFKKDYPQDASRFDQILVQMTDLLGLRQQRYKEARSKLGAFDLEIKKASAIWEMGQAAAAAKEGSGMSDEDFYAQLKVQTSMDSIQENLNRALVQLDTLMLDSNEPNLVIGKAPAARPNLLADSASITETDSADTDKTKTKQ